MWCPLQAQGLVKVVPVDGEVVSVVIESAPPSPRKERRQALDSQVRPALRERESARSWDPCTAVMPAGEAI